MNFLILQKICKRKVINFNTLDFFLFIAATIFSIVVYSVFKIFYPYPNLTFDSYHYVKAAVDNVNVCNWPIGYPKFIRWLGYISHSANFVIGTQYFLLQCSFLYFFLFVRKYYKIGRISSIILFAFLFLNPIFIYACNHLLSDWLFTAFSIIWLVHLLKIIFKFRPYLVFSQSLLLFLIFTLRYNAIFYPLVSLIVFLIALIPIKWKVIGILLSMTLPLIFVEFTSKEWEKEVGVKQFSYASGWKIASNSLYMYEHVYKNDLRPIPLEFKELDEIVRKYFDNPHIHVDLLHADKEVTTGSFYMANMPSPLIRYMLSIKKTNNWTIESNTTAPFGPLFGKYGLFLIKRYPFAFSKYVVYPQTISYFLPFAENLKGYPPAFELQTDPYGVAAIKWFNLKTLYVPQKYMNLRASLLYPYPIIFCIIHLYCILVTLIYTILNGMKSDNLLLSKGIFIIIFICIMNFLFMIVTQTSELRYQFHVIIFELFIILFFVENFFMFLKKKPA